MDVDSLFSFITTKKRFLKKITIKYKRFGTSNAKIMFSFFYHFQNF